MTKDTLLTKGEISDLLLKLEETLKAIKEDSYKFYEKGNSTAGKRVRGYVQDMKPLLQTIRVDIQAKKNEKLSKAKKN